jgi:hypothetical protein
VTVSINQPAYLPWLGYFERIAASDVHIVLDHVQFEKNSFVNRNKVRTREGWTWLTVPVLTKGRFGHLAINQLDLVAGHPWAKKHWSTLRMNYARAPFFPSYAPAYDALYAHPWSGFLPMAEAFLRQHLADLGIRTQILFSSTLGISGTKSDLVLNLCRAVGADRYLSGPLGRSYLTEADFEDAGIQLVYQDFKHPSYTQCQPGAFEPAMGVIDLISNHGPGSLAILLDRDPQHGIAYPHRPSDPNQSA